MANAWKRDNSKTQKLLSPKTLLSLLPLSLFLYLSFSLLSPKNPNFTSTTTSYETQKTAKYFPIPPFNCHNSPQSYPIIANIIENLKYPFIYSLADLGSLPDKPHKNIVRLLKGKPFRRPDISVTIQDFLEGKNKDGFVVDVGANVGMASFAAAVMGFNVLAFEPVWRICKGFVMGFGLIGLRNWLLFLKLLHLIGMEILLSISWLAGLTTVLFPLSVQSWHSSPMKK